jgi:8-oxo-dGTP pyrophosphatase MutT (NUDIX family)
MHNKIKAYGIALYIKDNNSIKLLLCKSISSINRWGFLKGGEEKDDQTPKQTAIREFKEESGISIDQSLLNKYFYQINDEKDIGIYLVDATNLKYINKYFKNGLLLNKYLCKENSQVKFFDIDTLPEFKKKQNKILNKIIKDLR